MNDDLFQQLVTTAARHSIEIKIGMSPTYNGSTPKPRLAYTFIDHCYQKSAAYLGPITDEILIDLIAFFNNTEEPMNIYSTDLFKYLSGDMIGQNTITLTITKFTEEKISAGGRGEQIKQCLHFKERDKTMVLNKTNAGAIAKELGPETDQWTGGRITLAAPVIDAFGQQRRAIRVVKVEPPDRVDTPDVFPLPRP